MLTLYFDRQNRDCEGGTRRDFLRIGALGLGALTLPDLLRAQAMARMEGRPTKEASVVWLWLGGGPTHIETFDPKPNAPSEFRSTVGEVLTTLPGVQLGSVFPKLAQHMKNLAVVRSFAHTNSGHGGGTHWVMTGHDFPPADQGQEQIWPSIGSITAASRGTTHHATGMPRYVALQRIYGDGPADLGVGHAPFEAGGQAMANMNLAVDARRLHDRRFLLAQFDRVKRVADTTGTVAGMSQFSEQAFSLITGKAKEAFRLEEEDPKTKDRYGSGLGAQLLVARRLCEAGAGFVTLHYGGWDMHGQIGNALRQRCPELDHAVAAFVADCVERGVDKNILLVITGEFGRTPRVNPGAGRDHWAPLSTLALAGGGLRMGQVVGDSNERAEIPKTTPISPQDLLATVYHVMGFDPNFQFGNKAGRPVAPLSVGEPIAELV